MKEYKLSGWPDLSAPYHRTCYRRMLSDMSHRYVSVAQLIAASSATRHEVRMFLEMLAERGVLRVREAESDSMLSSFNTTIGQWFRRGKAGGASKH
jgi:hypothetical protein